MNRVLRELKAGGVKDNETSTSTFIITPIYSQIPGTRENITGFRTTNSITIYSYNLNNLSKWIDISVKAGANNINGISFTLSDKKTSEVKNGITNIAIDDAIRKANSTSAKLGLHVLGIKSIAVGPFEPMLGSPQIIEPQGLASNTLSASNSRNSPILPGQLQISEQVRGLFLAGK